MTSGLVITGMGAITPIGLGVEEYWRNLIAGQCGVGEITRFDASRLPTCIAAEVKNFRTSEVLPRNISHGSAHFMQYAYAAGREALLDAGLDKCEDRHSVGICMATALAGIDTMADNAVAYANSASGKVSPHLVPRIMGNMAAANLSIAYGLRGPGLTLNTACSGGGDAVMMAAMLILAGQAQVMVAMGGECCLTPSVVSSLAQARALSRRNEDPATASRPFDLNRDGFVIGEGGGALVIETEEHATKRGAKIFARLRGWGNSLDAHHITAPDPEGKGAAACMRAALNRAGMNPEDIDYINTHGTSTQIGDRVETKAMKEVFGGKENTPPASSTKGATGHLMGAGGLTELIACIKSIEHGIMPPTLNLATPDPECDLDYVPNVARKGDINAAMSNSLGFGGQNSSIIVSRYKE